MRLFLIAGESSGDAHASALMRELLVLRPDSEFFGAGGPNMQAVAGPHLQDWIHEAAVVGLWDVLMKYPYFKKKFDELTAEIFKINPGIVIFVDYPGFNLRLASNLRKKGFKGKLIYYISPQVWAWNRGRIPKMAKILDLMLCLFPFEKTLYDASGLETVVVGHPMLDELAKKKWDQPRDPTLIALLPGSRLREVKRIFPPMLEAAQILSDQNPKLHFAAGAANERLASLMRELADKAGFSATKEISIEVHRSSELMQRASVGMVASGTATMEATYFRFPFVLVYAVSWLTYIPGRLLIKVDYLGMPNLLGGKPIVPEYIQQDATGPKIAEGVWRLISDSTKQKEMIAEMNAVIESLGSAGAAKRAAEAIIGRAF
jgi:lipid-A-disaccharide synthase